MSWRRPRSPVTIVVGRPVAWAAPMPEETRPSMPLAPRLQRKSDVGLAGGEEGLLVANRHARGGVDEVAVAVGRAERAVERRLAELVAAPPAPPPSASRGLRSASASSQAVGAAAAPSSRRAAQPAASSVGSARRIAAARLRRLVPAAVGSIDDLLGARWRRARRAAACWSASSPKRRTKSGTTEPGEVLVAQQRS